MARNHEPVELPDVIHRISKNSTEDILAYLGEFEGHALAHLRVWWRDAADELRPSRKGIAIPVRLLPEIEIAIQKLRSAVKEGQG